jgi:hypothetical protein
MPLRKLRPLLRRLSLVIDELRASYGTDGALERKLSSKVGHPKKFGDFKKLPRGADLRAVAEEISRAIGPTNRN